MATTDTSRIRLACVIESIFLNQIKYFLRYFSFYKHVPIVPKIRK